MTTNRAVDRVPVVNRIGTDPKTAGTVAVPRATIPAELTSFVGRSREAMEVRRLLDSSRLVTLTGAAGCGKTRLALRVATEVHRDYAGGVHWVELATLADPALVPQAIGRVLGVTEQPGRSMVDGLLDALRETRLLLVLDNCEHVLRACSQLVEALVTTEARILATSREPLRVTGEMRYPLSPLSLPPLPLPVDELHHYEAVQLFIERARATLPDFTLTPDNSALVASICRRLDGLPLAIELVSAGVNILTIAQIEARLDDRLEQPASSSGQTQSHHRTLRAAIDWSFDLLPETEQVMLRRLSVFAGGCSLETAELVCAGDGIERDQVLELLSALIDRSLVVAETLQRSEARYSLLETIRQYAREKLLASGEGERLQDRHLRSFLQLAEDAEPKLGGPYQHLWLNWLEREHANVRVALTAALERRYIEEALRLVNALYQYWTIRDYVQEGLAWFNRLLAQADEHVSPIVRAQALAYAAFLSGFRGNTSEQIRFGREAAALAQDAGAEGKPALAWALAAMGHGARAAGDHEAEFALARRAIQVRREIGDPFLLGVTLSVYSPTAMVLAKYEDAHRMLDEALPLLREAGNPYRIAMALNYSGDLARCERRYAQAQVAYQASATLLREIGATRDLASALHNWGHACLRLGEVEGAAALLRESLALQQAQRNTAGTAECLIGFAALAVARGLPGAGARLLAATESLGGPRIASAWAATRMEYEHCGARARARLTPAEFQAEQTAGRAFSLEQAVALAEDVVVKGPHGAQPNGLTVREREVVALVALGKSNGEIAGDLVVSKRTVEKHIAHILAKLGFANRSEVVRWAVETGLVRRSAS